MLPGLTCSMCTQYLVEAQKYSPTMSVLFTSSGVFGVRNLCFSMSASILAFSIICLFASVFFDSFFPCILFAFSGTSLVDSLSLCCFAVVSAVFLPPFGLSPWAILFISIFLSSGTFWPFFFYQYSY